MMYMLTLANLKAPKVYVPPPEYFIAGNSLLSSRHLLFSTFGTEISSTCFT